MEINAAMKITNDDEKTMLSKESAMLLIKQVWCQDINMLNREINFANRFLYKRVLY